MWPIHIINYLLKVNILAKYSVQTTPSMQSIKTPLKSYLEVFKIFETMHTNIASIDMHCDKF